MIDFVDHIMPQSASASDINISSSDGRNAIDSGLAEMILDMDGVKQVYGRRSSFDIPAGLNGDRTLASTIDLVSFDDFDLDCLKKDRILRQGSDLSKSMVTVGMSLQHGIRAALGKSVIKFLLEPMNLRLQDC